MDYIRYVREMVGHAPLIMVGAGVAVFDQEKRLLLQRRADTNTWALNGGFMELGESIEDTARREVFEETGLTLTNLELFIYSLFETHKNTAQRRPNSNRPRYLHLT